MIRMKEELTLNYCKIKFMAAIKNISRCKIRMKVIKLKQVQKFKHLLETYEIKIQGHIVTVKDPLQKMNKIGKFNEKQGKECLTAM